jgi:purine-nucleoside phosphorylase
VTREELRERLFSTGAGPEWGLVLGSGFDVWLDHLSPGEKVSFHSLDGLSPALVPGHGGFFTAGCVSGKPVAVVAGRLHLYENRTAEQVVEPVRALHDMGVSSVLLTTAVGGVNPDLISGDRVVVTDQLNLTAEDPHAGKGVFPDTSLLYDRGYIEFLSNRGLKRGVLAGVRGPSYETPAEVRALEVMGADIVCMSTVLEALALSGAGIKCVGVAVVANRAGNSGITHEGVLQTVRASAEGIWPVVSALMTAASG